MSNNTGTQTVLLSKSNNFSDNNTFPKVSGALVIISDNNGNIDTLQETVAGTYATSQIAGHPGVTYSLYVSVEGNKYTAQSIMPIPVKLDTLIAVEQTFFGKKGYYPQVIFQDPANVANYYRFETELNGKRTKGYTLLDDKFSNGNVANRVLGVDTGNDPDPAVGDTYEVTMTCMDQAVFKYFYSLAQSQTGNSGAPDNPVTNISGGALGYFSAQTDQIKSVTIEQ